MMNESQAGPAPSILQAFDSVRGSLYAKGLR
jgi:hypothetical protein